MPIASALASSFVATAVGEEQVGVRDVVTDEIRPPVVAIASTSAT
jgi:hypothetical protein